MGKQTLVLAFFFLASCLLVSANPNPRRNLNANPEDALGFYDNPYIPPIIKGLLNPLIPYIPDPPTARGGSRPPPTTPSTPKPPPSTQTPPVQVPPSPRTPVPPSTGSINAIVYNGSGFGFANGYFEIWWYQIDANGNVYASPNFFNDPAVPDGIKQQVTILSNYLKNNHH